ncbi:ABC transporter permease [Streptomyces sp. SID8379]|uniref:ABC transporter permease n=1 Tax=unclassified Streptomyces TaxID=2593676 RepID=UPI0003711D7E|nr:MULTISPECIES: ABC transporter permease [unclassified Streptomyces]MYW65852.1 ABC transporter permease [Streptomyces sp. SID8379]
MNVMLELELKRAFGDWRLIIFTIGMPLVIYMATASQFDEPIDGTPVARYLLVSMAVFGAIGAALSIGGPRVATEREIGWTRQLRLTAMSGVQYVVVKLLAAAVVTLISIVAVLALGAFANDVRMSPGEWLMSAGLVWGGSWVFCVLSVVLGYLFTSSSITVGLMVVNMGFSMLGGLFWPVDGMPHWMKLVAEATPTYHLAQLGHFAQEGNWPAGSDLAVLGGYLLVSVAGAAWLYRRDEVRV